MSWGLWSILVAGLLPYVATACAKWGFKGYDNNNPRAWLAHQTGFRARGHAAQLNSFESFPFFAAAILVATWRSANPEWVDAFATAYIVARIAYIYLYVRDCATYRSIAWLMGILSIVGLFVIAS